LTRLAKDLNDGPGIFAELGHTNAAYVYRLHTISILYRWTR
jgi:hypothetical protein